MKPIADQIQLAAARPPREWNEAETDPYCAEAWRWWRRCTEAERHQMRVDEENMKLRAVIERTRSVLTKIAHPDTSWGHMKLIARDALLSNEREGE